MREDLLENEVNFSKDVNCKCQRSFLLLFVVVLLVVLLVVYYIYQNKIVRDRLETETGVIST